MRRFVRNRILLITLASWFLYWPVAYFVSQDVILELVNGMIASLSIGLAVAYAPGVWLRLRTNPYRVSGADLLVLGIAVVQIAISGLFVWAWAFRILNTPEWMVDHVFRGWIVYLLVIGGVLQLIASDVGPTYNAIPEKGWAHLGIATALGLGFGVLVLTLERL